MRKSFRSFVFAALLALLIPLVLRAGGDDTPTGARRTALGGAFTGVKGDLWALWTNPAGIAGMQGPAAGVYFERRYLIPDLNNGAAGFVMPFKGNHFAGIDFNAYGISQYYNESRVGLTYATDIIERLRFGVKFNYTQTSILNYGSASSFFIDAGIQADVTKKIIIGARVYNANRARLDKDLGEDIPTLLSMGVAWKPSDKLMLVSDVEKHFDFPITWRGGIEYKFHPHFCARAGMSTQPATVNGGVGLMLEKLQVDITSSWHDQLGFTPGMSLSWKFGKKKETEVPVSR
jgi:hypothetical protein